MVIKSIKQPVANNCEYKEYPSDNCQTRLNCCDCGMRENGCGCRYCWSCNACDICYSEE